MHTYQRILERATYHTPSVNQCCDACKSLLLRISVHIKLRSQAKAMHTYQRILERYPTSPKVLRAYARFLEDVKNDPWSAVKYYA